MSKAKVNHMLGISGQDAGIYIRRGKNVYWTLEPQIVEHESEVKLGTVDKIEIPTMVYSWPLEIRKHLKTWRRRSQNLGLACRDCGACCVGADGMSLQINIPRQDQPIDLDRINAIRPGSIVQKNCDGEPILSLVDKGDGICACPFWDKELGCSIYSDRIRTCKTFTPGNWACLRMRALVLPKIGREHLISDKEKAFYEKHESKKLWKQWMTVG